MDQIRLYNNLNYNKKLSRCFLCVGRCRETSRNIANRCSAKPMGRGGMRFLPGDRGGIAGKILRRA